MTNPFKTHLGETVAAGLFLLAVGGVSAHCLTGCRGGGAQAEPAIVEKRAINAADLVTYQIDLDACRELGKDAGSFAIYESCASSADKKFGVNAKDGSP